MTLPSYSVSARPSEKIIGREGDRAGIDTVVEYPEDSSEEEARREEEMASLYQIRQARREQQARRREGREERREERRRTRREGRATMPGMVPATGPGRANRYSSPVEYLASRSNVAVNASAPNPEEMMAEHQSRERGRRISSVAYASLGVARHDGSRVRSDSASSDNRPLLDGAAGMGGADRASVGSNASLANTGRERRDRSTSQSLQHNGVPGERWRTVSTSSLSRFITPDSEGVSDSERSSVDLATPSRSRSQSRSHSRNMRASDRPTSTSGSRFRTASVDMGEPAGCAST